jgi:GxxExxY protein
MKTLSTTNKPGTRKTTKLLYPELSYQVQGAAIEVRKNYGSGHKESLYQNAFAEELTTRKIPFEREASIQIKSPKTGKLVGSYKPDFLIDDKIIVEIKALEVIPRKLIDQLFDYLRNSNYELGYFINFAGPKLYMRRIIYTNDRKQLRGA